MRHRARPLYRPEYVPDCQTGKSGRYYVTCYDYKTNQRFNIGWKLTKARAIRCASGCGHLLATVCEHAHARVVYRNELAQALHERKGAE